MKQRPPIEHMVFMAQVLRAGRPLNLSDVAGLFEVCLKSIYRDLDFMRDRLGYELRSQKGPQGRFVWHLVSAPKSSL